MGHNGKDEIMFHEIDASQCASAMVEIKIKTLDSQTYTLHVDKCVSVPALKEQIASVTGVVTEQQRLICRGKVMKDDQLLSAYHVEDGHTLHLVVRQPIQPLSESSTSNAADPALSAGDSQGSQRSRVVVGSFNIAEQADGAYSDIGQIVSAVLGSLGISNTEGGIEGLEAMGSLHEGLSQSSGPSTARDTSGGRSVVPNSVNLTSTPMTSSQPATIPDSLTTLSEYLNHLRQEFAANGSNATNLHETRNSMGNAQDLGSTTGESRILRPSHLAEVLQSTRRLLIGEVADCLSNLSRQLEDHVNVTDPTTRRLCQSNMLQSGPLLENLGISLLELGRATMMLRMGQTPDDAVVDTGPAVFISPTGRNPLPSHSSRLGTSMGGLRAGNTHSSPFGGQSLASAPRNIEIRIRTGSWMPTSGANQREESSTQQNPGQSAPSSIPESVTSEPPRNPMAFVIPVVATYEQLSSAELNGVQQPVTMQPQSIITPGGREGDSSGGRGLSELRNRIHQFLRPLSRRDILEARSSESQVAANPSDTASAGTNEAIANANANANANAQAEPAPETTDEGNFISSVLQQIMPFISQHVPSSSSAEAGSNSTRQTSSREAEEGLSRSSLPESKRQKRE